MVELDVSQPHEVDFPAFTICNLNERFRICCLCPFQSLLSVKKRSDVHDDVAWWHIGFLSYDTYITIAKHTKTIAFSHCALVDFSREEIQAFGHQLKDLMVDCKIEIEGNEEDCKGDPILISVLSHSNRMPFNCYMFLLFVRATSRFAC
ncbi:uncharacterized protein CEXT_301081 [Caerostris extrusa]|uniref:Uncharacterized protein n=1 Tax=Caerostris extrusa TaxID=172846 RepID=A0AAV4MQE5_CAEEX|nr:uncharacterized protein CEXT_301081 [Caerostris extrusa]